MLWPGRQSSQKPPPKGIAGSTPARGTREKPPPGAARRRLLHVTSSSKRGLLFAMAAAALYGGVSPFEKQLLARGLDEIELAGMLYLGAAIGLVALSLLPRTGKPLERRDLKYLLVATVFGG